MHSLSLFQLLPPHIVELIVDYVANDCHLLADGTTRYAKEYRDYHTPLLWVCRSLRDDVYLRHTRSHRLVLNNAVFKTGIHNIGIQCPWVFCRQYNHYLTHHLAKVLIVEVDLQYVYSGEAFDALEHAPYDDCVLPMARTLTFRSILDKKLPDLSVDPTMAKVNAAAFVQRLRQIAPRACEFRMCGETPSFSTTNTTRLFSKQLTDLLTNILRTTDRFLYMLGTGSELDILELSGVQHLVHIDIEHYPHVVHVFQLTRQCAPTLQSLKLRYDHGFTRGYCDTSGLIQNPDGSYVQYSCLRKLYLNLWLHSYEPQQPEFGNMVPFPALQHLTILYDNPFGDDTLFRGNAATLESLHIQVDWTMATILRDRRVFTPSSHPKLQSVSVKNNGCIYSSRFVTEVDYLQFVLNIGPDVSVRKITGIAFDSCLPRALSLLGNCTSILVLELQDTKLTLSDVVTLIKSLPLLSDLKTSYPSLGPMPDHVTKAGLSKYMLRTHGPVGDHFRRWHIMSDAFATKEAAECVMQLALICPSFLNIFVRKDPRGLFMQFAMKFASLSMFRRHYHRLERLISSGYPRKYSETEKCPYFG